MDTTVKRKMPRNLPNNSARQNICPQEMEKLQSVSENCIPIPGTSLTSNAGLVYYKFLSSEMEKEIKTLKEKLNHISSTNKTQKQNILAMENQKQTMIAEFHEQLRQFNLKINFEKKLDQGIERVAPFLQQLIQLKTEISNLREAEMNIRNYIMQKYQSIYPEFESIRKSYEMKVLNLQEKAEKIEEKKKERNEYADLDSKLNNSTLLLKEEINNLKWSIKDADTTCNQLKQDHKVMQIEFKMQNDDIQREIQKCINEIWKSFTAVRGEFSILKKNIETENSNFQLIQEKLKKNLNEKSIINNELRKDITERQNSINNHQAENEAKQSELCELQSNVSKLENEIQSLTSSVSELEIKTNDQKSSLTTLLECEKIYKEKKLNLISELSELKCFEHEYSTSEKKLNENTLKEGFFSNTIAELISTKNAIKKSIIDLKDKAQKKEQQINEYKKNFHIENLLNIDINSKDKEFLQTYLSIEYERNTITKHIESELDHLYDEICELQITIGNLKDTLSREEEESLKLDESLETKEKILKNAIEDVKFYETSIQTLKQNVYQGKFVTQQDLNKKLTVVQNAIKSEQVSVNKLKDEINKRNMNAENKLSTGKKLIAEGKRSIYSQKSPIPSKAPQNVIDIDSSPNKDIYSYK